MVQQDFHGIKLPALGLGCMRLPTDASGAIAEAETERMVAYAMAHGVNYFDTGYDYHGGASETTIGRILAQYDRASYLLADKFPGYDPLKWRKAPAVFAEQLARCGVSYFDFYLLHNVTEANIDAYLNPRYNIVGYLRERQAAGEIRHLGFSAHGGLPTLKRLLAAHADAFSFALLQVNYVDFDFQKAREKLELLASYGIPVFVMEPLRGGKLARLPEPFAARFAAEWGDVSQAEAAFRFVQSLPEVRLVLSGMSSFAQLAENIRIFSERRPLAEQERARLFALAAEMTAVGTVPCTECRYCVERCPAGLDIPALLGYYNEHMFSGGGFLARSAVAGMRRDKRPSACIGCKTCEAFCPQQIAVADVMADFCKRLDLKG